METVHAPGKISTRRDAAVWATLEHVRDRSAGAGERNPPVRAAIQKESVLPNTRVPPAGRRGKRTACLRRRFQFPGDFRTFLRAPMWNAGKDDTDESFRSDLSRSE